MVFEKSIQWDPMLILDFLGISFHAVVVSGLGLFIQICSKTLCSTDHENCLANWKFWVHVDRFRKFTPCRSRHSNSIFNWIKFDTMFRDQWIHYEKFLANSIDLMKNLPGGKLPIFFSHNDPLLQPFLV